MDSLNIFDWVLLVIVIISCIYSLNRGFIKEFLLLISWSLALFLAYKFSFLLSQFSFTKGLIEHYRTRMVFLFIFLFVIILLLGTLVINIFSNLVRSSFLNSADKFFGAIFGLVRGFIVNIIIIFILSHTSWVENDWWINSLFLPYLRINESWSIRATDGIENLFDLFE